MSESPPPDDGANKPEAPVRVCRNCSAQSQTDSDNCPHCGASFIRSRRMRTRRRLGGWSRRRKVLTLGIIAALIGGAAAAGIIIKTNHDNAVAAEHREVQEEREAIAAAKLAKERTQQRAALRLQREEEKDARELAKIEREYGKESVAELEKDITNYANEEAEEGFSETVSKTDCEADGGKVYTSLTAQNFHCIAVTGEEGEFENGYRYSGTINYTTGNLSWRLGGE
jgi:ribosomal protein L40E